MPSPEGQRCVNCRAEARRTKTPNGEVWEITHTRTCPDFARPDHRTRVTATFPAPEVNTLPDSDYAAVERRLLTHLGVDPAAVTTFKEVYGVGRPEQGGNIPR